MKTLVRVTVCARKDVIIEVTHESDEDPTDLTCTDRENAFDAFRLGQDPDLETERVEEVTT